MMKDQQLPLFGQDPTLSPSAVPAKTCQLREDVPDWLRSEAVFSTDAWLSVLNVKPVSWSGKTCLEFSVATRGTTLPVYLRRLQDTALASRQEAGEIPECALDRSIPLPGLCWTRNGSEFRSGGVASSLSDILETGDLPTKYYLSAKACRGILRRAEKRGRALPQALHAALTQVAAADTQDEGETMRTSESKAIDTTEKAKRS